MTDFSKEGSLFTSRHGRPVEPKPGSGSAEEAKPAAAEAPKKKERAYSLGKALGGLISRAKEGFAATGRHAKEVAMPAWDRVLAAKQWVLEKRSRAEVSIDVSKTRTDDGVFAEKHGSESSEELDVVDGFPDHYINRDTKEIVQEVRNLRTGVMGRLTALEAYLQDEIKQAGDADETDLLEENRSLHQELREVRTKKKIINIMAANVTNAHKREKSFREMGEEMKALEEKQKIVAMLEKLIDLDNELKGADGGSKETGFLRATAQEIFAQFGQLNVRELFKRLGTDPELRDAAIAMGTQTALKLLLGTTGVGSGVVLGVVKGVRQEVSMNRVADQDALAARVQKKYATMTDRFGEFTASGEQSISQSSAEPDVVSEVKKQSRWARALEKMSGLFKTGVTAFTLMEKVAVKLLVQPDGSRRAIKRFVSQELIDPSDSQAREKVPVTTRLQEMLESLKIEGNSDTNYIDKLNKINQLYDHLVKLDVLGYPQDPTLAERWANPRYKEQRAREVELHKQMLAMIEEFVQTMFATSTKYKAVEGLIAKAPDRQKNKLKNIVEDLVEKATPENKRKLALGLGRKMYVAEMIGMIGRGGVLDLLVGRPQGDFDTQASFSGDGVDEPSRTEVLGIDSTAVEVPEAEDSSAWENSRPLETDPLENEKAQPPVKTPSREDLDSDFGLENPPAVDVYTPDISTAKEIIPSGFVPEGGWATYPANILNSDGTINFSADGFYALFDQLGANSEEGISGFARMSLEKVNPEYVTDPLINLSTRIMQELNRSLTETEIQALVDAFNGEKPEIADMYQSAARKIAEGANPEGYREDMGVVKAFINTVKKSA